MRPILNQEQLEVVFPHGVTKEELAKYYGLTTFDVAIPQQLFDQLATEEPYFHPWGHYVFDYSTHTTSWGALFPLTQEGISQMENVFGNAFVDPRKQP